MRERSEFGAALLAVLLGGAAVLLISTRHWQHAVLPRPRPLADDVLDISGRTVNAAPTALGLVALAGVVAVLATRGWARRAVGLALSVSGLATVWVSLTGLGALGSARVRSLDAAAHSGVGIDASVTPRVDVHATWPWLSAAAGVFVLLGGLLVLARGHRWRGLSSRYQAPAAAADVANAPIAPVAPLADFDADARRRNDVALWNALDHGSDPTLSDTSAGPDHAAPADRRADGADTLG